MPQTLERTTKETPVPGRPYSARLVRRLRSKVRSLFRDQYADAMDILDRAAGRKILGDLEPNWRSMFTPEKLKRWSEDTYSEIEAGYKMGAKAGVVDIREGLELVGRERLEFGVWDVEQPNARAAVSKAAFDLSASANGVTQKKMDSLVPKFRAEVMQGIATGETYDWMSGRIKDIFGHADKYRSQVIAISETQRAIHQGLLEQYRESGVVEATQWLTSGAPCPICEAIALENEQGVALFREYANDGKGGTYSSVAAPPAHPGCLCSLFPILIPVERMPQARAA
jgi:hypothetical protein